MMKKVCETIELTGPSIKGLVKLALLSKRPSLGRKRFRVTGDRPLIVMGNGPSLAQTIAEHADILATNRTMAVNFAANAPEFAMLKPDYYILVDPHFFSGKDDVNLNTLYANLAAVDWPMTLIVPAGKEKIVPAAVKQNQNIAVATINAIGVEGWKWLTAMAYGSGRAMPRPRNVLIPAIMAGVLMGYKQIYVVGADHSWMKTLSVDDDNRVVSVQPHFYKDNEKELKRISTDYKNVTLPWIVHSFYVAFKAYHDIENYARGRGIEIYNSTPASMIDAFRRRPLPKNQDKCSKNQ